MNKALNVAIAIVGFMLLFMTFYSLIDHPSKENAKKVSGKAGGYGGSGSGGYGGSGSGGYK